VKESQNGGTALATINGGISGDSVRDIVIEPSYRNYVLGLLFVGYILNAVDRGLVGVLAEPIRHAFNASDTTLGVLNGVAFAIFYSFLGIPIAAFADRTNRRNVLAAAIALWSAMTALCGLALKLPVLFIGRIGTSVGEAGGSPPSHSIIADYFPPEKRGTALSVYALAVPIGTMLSNLIGGWGNEFVGWRLTFILIGIPGVILALLIVTTVRELPRGHSDVRPAVATSDDTPHFMEVFRLLWKRTAFRHLSLAAGLHSLVWYAGSSFNNAFLMRTHGMTSGEGGSWLALFSGLGVIGTFLGGYLSDRLSIKTGDRRWYLWVPGIATLAMVPFQFSSYLVSNLWILVPSFSLMFILASVFFGPSFAMTQALVTVRMRAMAASVLLFVQTIVGYTFGPWLTGVISDHLKPSMGNESLAYALVITGIVNIWAAGHYFWGARTLRQDLETTEALTKAGKHF
jgi:MFS family permease